VALLRRRLQQPALFLQLERPEMGGGQPLRFEPAENADGTGERFVAVLEIPPVDSPQTAAQMAIYSDIKKGKK
jgi:hypothetical protein